MIFFTFNYDRGKKFAVEGCNATDGRHQAKGCRQTGKWNYFFDKKFY